MSQSTTIRRASKLLMAACLIGLPAVAAAELAKGDRIGITNDEITTMLEAEGYSVLEIETEKDELEVEVVLDGATFEIELDPMTGLILEIESDDDEGDDEEDDD